MSRGKVFETHLEAAIRLRVPPGKIKHLALNHELGDFGSSGGVIYFPLNGNDVSFFEELVRIRHSLT